MSEKYCTNCGLTKEDLICVVCHKRTLEIYEKKQEQKDIKIFLEKLEALEQHATHSNNPFANLAWVKNAIKNEIKIYKKRLVEN